ncbi:MAG TPA: hypothetical protein VF740_02890, partial [Candidatus Acidoferrum sp.]
ASTAGRGTRRLTPWDEQAFAGEDDGTLWSGVIAGLWRLRYNRLFVSGAKGPTDTRCTKSRSTIPSPIRSSRWYH